MQIDSKHQRIGSGKRSWPQESGSNSVMSHKSARQLISQLCQGRSLLVLEK